MTDGQGASSSNAIRRVRVRVSGRVQGVAYRASACMAARAHGLVGWVRNLPDGSVELEAQGSEPQVALFLVWCHRGPPSAKVSGLDLAGVAVEVDAVGFEIRR